MRRRVTFRQADKADVRAPPRDALVWGTMVRLASNGSGAERIDGRGLHPPRRPGRRAVLDGLVGPGLTRLAVATTPARPGHREPHSGLAEPLDRTLVEGRRVAGSSAPIEASTVFELALAAAIGRSASAPGRRWPRWWASRSGWRLGFPSSGSSTGPEAGTSAARRSGAKAGRLRPPERRLRLGKREDPQPEAPAAREEGKP